VVRVVDLATDVAGRFAAKLLAMAGLDVVRPGPEDHSVLGRYLDLHKRAVTEALLVDADVVFTTFDRGGVTGAGTNAAAQPRRPECVEVTTSSFGMTGPYASWRGGPMAEWAAGGYLALTGWPDREPLIGPEHLCGYIGGYTAAIAAEAALRRREQTGRGAHVDLSTMESMLNVHQSTFSRLAAGIVRERSGRYTEVYPLVVRPCRDGYVSIGVVTDVEFDRLVIAIDRPELATDARFLDAVTRWEHRDALDAELATFLDGHDADDVVRVLDAHGLAAAKVADASDVLANPQLAHRGFWDTIAVERTHSRVPGNPVPASVAFADDGAATRLPPSFPTTPRDDELPLADVTVLDFSAFWAGPSATRLLADLGARVLWVERPGSRLESDATTAGTDLVMHFFHLKMNRNKESVVLDLTSPAGRDLARRLALDVDVVVENFRPGVMDALGLGPADLCRANPALVYASLSGFGSRGPWSARRSYGPTIEAASSIEDRTGYVGGEPLRLGHTLPDGVGGLTGALAVLRGLRERADRGTGGWFDLSQLEAYTAVGGDELLLMATTGCALERIGNRSRTGALQGVFPCAGTDQWIAIRLSEEHDAQRFADVAGVPLVSEATIASYTVDRDNHDLARYLQHAGLEAFPVLTPPELLDDPNLAARGFFVDVEFGGTTFRLPGTPLHGLADPTGPAPRFGEHTDAVLASAR
jgi:crotonobetainyl-CoA:carnitine CoA-transferase CaiB-like acyl-CoA transferase